MDKVQTASRLNLTRYELEEYGSRILLLNMKELEEIQETLEVYASADDETKRIINYIAIELKDRTEEEAKEIIREYRKEI